MATSYDIKWTARILATLLDPNDYLFIDVAPSTSKLEISASIYSLYVYGSWSFSADRNLFDEGRLVVGNIIQFDFFPDTRTLSYQLAILSISSTQGPLRDPTYPGDVYTVTLVSPWYFDQVIKSKAYLGGTTAILRQLFKEELPDSFSNVNLVESMDNAKTVRYRTIQTPGRFIEDRLMSNIRGINNTTPFIYTNLKNEFELIDASSIQVYQPYVAISMKSPHFPYYQAELNDSLLSHYFLFPDAFVISINNGPSKQLWHLTSPGMLYLYRADGLVNTVDSLPVLQALTHDNTNPYTFVSGRKPVGLTKVYNDDSFNNYGDILSEVINTYSKDLIDNFSINLVCPPNLDTDIGRSCYLDVIQDGTKVASRFSQKYLIRTVSHVFQGFRGATHVELTATSMSYDKVSDVPNLFHL